MEEHQARCAPVEWFFEVVFNIIRRFLIGILTIGPIPCHIGLIMDGNRRYEKTRSLSSGMGHRAGYASLMNLLKGCSDIGVKYVTAYAFSIDNFNRPADEVEALMELFQEKIEGMTEPGSNVHQYGYRVHFIGNLKLLSESVQLAAENAMKATAHHNQSVLSICIAYTSTNEILNAVQESCDQANTVPNCMVGKHEHYSINLIDMEKRMYMAVVAPDPDMVIRSSGQTRLSNFLLWQTSNSLLHTTAAFWPEVGSGHLVWALLNYQLSCSYLKKKIKQV